MWAAARALDASSSSCRRRSKLLASIAWTKVSTTAAILSASRGVMPDRPFSKIARACPARPLFSLFYLVEIRHPQLFQSQSRTR
jgi:hypothetical protein